ncbi:MAG TPA: transcription termination/antitermination protein NusG [Lacipirellulaceae bacterium]|jgi:transcriptional antiterminator NusG|nr:transcription termination/antitermination protein NusG [Lacipirellulaceae bacterium]
MTDDQPAHVADDAVSNRSDDTALEEANGHRVAEKGSGGGEPEAAAAPAGEASEEVSSVDSEKELIAESEAAEAEEEVTEEAEDEAEPEEDENSPAAIARRKPVELASDEPEEIHMDWYILKVQSNRERTIAEALERKMRIEGYDKYFDQVVVPTEKVTEFKGGKKKVVERKLYPGYIVVHMHINDDTWFAVRETSGVGDFTGAGGKPTPMLASEVSRIVQTDEEETSESPKLDIKFAVGDKIKVKEGNFENFEGEVAKIDEASGRVTVLIHIFGRSTQVELEYWQIEAV